MAICRVCWAKPNLGILSKYSVHLLPGLPIAKKAAQVPLVQSSSPAHTISHKYRQWGFTAIQNFHICLICDPLTLGPVVISCLENNLLPGSLTGGPSTI